VKTKLVELDVILDRFGVCEVRPAKVGAPRDSEGGENVQKTV